MSVVETQSLTKLYGKSRGIESVDLCVDKGEVFGFLGPNGAGKTTTIRLLLNLIKPTSGEARVFGLDSVKASLAIRSRTGYLPGEPSLYPQLTGRAWLNYMLSLRDQAWSPRITELARRLGAELNKPLKHASKGMRQKVALLGALAPAPELLVLDEPTNGLDPLTQQVVYDILAEERAAGTTIFLSSHILPEVERVCDRVAMIRSGQIALVERVASLKARRVKTARATFRSPPERSQFNIPGLTASFAGLTAEFTIRGPLSAFLAVLAASGVESLVMEESKLEDVFLSLYEGEGTAR